MRAKTRARALRGPIFTDVPAGNCNYRQTGSIMREGWEGGEKLECKRESGRRREKEDGRRERE